MPAKPHPVHTLGNGLLSETLEACVAPLETAEPRPMIDLGFGPAVDLALGKNWLENLRPAAVLVAVRRVWPEPRVVFTVRTRKLRAHAGQISFPGGRADPTDDFPLGTALREANEETAIRTNQIAAIGLLDDYPTVSKYRVTPVVGWMDADTRTRAHRDEVDEIFEVPLRHLLDPGNYKRSMIARFGGVKVFEIHHGSYRIWGATAGMLWNLQERFNATLETIRGS